MKDTMRLLHLNDHLNWVGGIESYLLSAIGHLRERGFRQSAIYGKGDPSFVDDPTCIPAVSSPRPGDRGPVRAAVTEAIRRFDPELIQVHNLYNTGAIDACLSERPTAVYVHDFRYACPASSFYFRRSNRICERVCSPACFALGPLRRCLTPRTPLNLWYYQRVRWMKRNAHRFSAIIAISGYVRDRLIRSGFPAGKIHVIPYFCPLEPVDAPPSPPEKPCILFMGRMARYKGFDQFVRILARLPESISGLMIGNASESVEREVLGLAEDLGCRDRLTLRGWASRDEIRGIMQRMTVVTFPSVCPETLGLVGMESMASGVPVVGFDVGGTSEWLHDGHNGYSVPVNDLDAFAQRVVEIVQSESLRAELGRNGLEVIRSRFSADYHFDRLLSVYRSCGNRSPAAAADVSLSPNAV